MRMEQQRKLTCLDFLSPSCRPRLRKCLKQAAKGRFYLQRRLFSITSGSQDGECSMFEYRTRLQYRGGISMSARDIRTDDAFSLPLSLKPHSQSRSQTSSSSSRLLEERMRRQHESRRRSRPAAHRPSSRSDAPATSTRS